MARDESYFALAFEIMLDTTKTRSLLNRLRLLVVGVGPAFFLIGYNIGTGSVVSMASAGSRYGMSLLWALVLSCVFSFVMLEAYGRYTLVTGKTALFSYKQFRCVGQPLAIGTLIGLVFVELIGLAGIVGIMADLVSQWSRMFITPHGWNPVWIALTMIVGMYAVLLVGKYSVFERILIVFVAIMGASFLLTMFLVIPEPSEILKGAIPQIPGGANAAMIIGALVGTTLSAPTYLVRSALVQQKGWKTQHLKHARTDSLVTALLLFVISMSVMACAAGTLYTANQPIEDAITMIVLLEPLAGRFAVSIFLVGILAAGLSSIIPIVMLAPILIADYRGVPTNMKSPMFRILCTIGLAFGLVVPLFHARPVAAMIASMCCQIFLLPVVALSIIYLLNRKDLMGRHKAGFWLNLGCAATFVFSLFITYQSILGLIHYCQDIEL